MFHMQAEYKSKKGSLKGKTKNAKKNNNGILVIKLSAVLKEVSHMPMRLVTCL